MYLQAFRTALGVGLDSHEGFRVAVLPHPVVERLHRLRARPRDQSALRINSRTIHAMRRCRAERKALGGVTMLSRPRHGQTQG